MNIAEPFWRNHAAFPERVALIGDGRALTYRQLGALVSGAAAQLAALGIGRGDVVAVALPAPVLSVATLLALFGLGAVGTPHRPLDPEATRAELVARNGVRFLVAPSEDPVVCRGQAAVRWIPGRTLFAAPQAQHVVPPPLAADIPDAWCYIALSSGTTGVPKSVPVTHRMNMLGIAMPSWLGNPDRSRVLIFADVMIQLAVREWLRGLACGDTVVLSRDSRPEAFFEVVRRDAPVRVITTTGLATSIVAYAEQSGIGPERSACVGSVQLAGSAVSPSLRERIARRLSGRLEVDYGATEIGSVAGLDPEARAVADDAHGRLHPWVEAQAVDEDGRPLPAGVAGALRFRAEAMASGYLGDEPATLQAFRGGWYHPGDIGSVDPAGFLRLVGRADSRLNLGGAKVSRERIESVLDALPGVRESAVLALGHTGSGRPVLVAAVVTEDPVDEAALRQACAGVLNARELPRRFFRVDALPRNVGGKVQREALAALLSARMSTPGG